MAKHEENLEEIFDELFQEYCSLPKEELPGLLEKFTKVEACCMAAAAQWCIQGLIEGKEIWDGVPCEQE